MTYRPRAIVLFECSGVVRRELQAVGFDAYSCDLKPADDGDTAHHFQTDAIAMVRSMRRDSWALLIAHPPCTYLCTSAAWAFGDGPYHQKVKPGTLVGADRRLARYEALQVVQTVMDAPVERIAIENPIGAITKAIRPADQYVQPYQFGDDASKRTGLWLKGLPKLRPTKHVPGMWAASCGHRWDQSRGSNCPWPECGALSERLVWGNQTTSGQNRESPRPERAAVRSQTYTGIARAMAAQWGPLCAAGEIR